KKSSYIKKQNLNMPILLLSGKEDHFGGFGTGIKKLATLYKRNGVKHVTVQLYKNKRHEVLFETNQFVVYEHIFNWLMTQIKQLKNLQRYIKEMALNMSLYNYIKIKDMKYYLKRTNL